MTDLTYDEIRQRGQAVIDDALPLRDESNKLEEQVDAKHPAAPLTRDAGMNAHWAFRDAQDAMHMVSAKLLLKAECRLGSAKVILAKAKEAIESGAGATEITRHTPDIPVKYVRAFISERAITFDEADAPISAFVTRGEKPWLYDAWTAHIYEHWTSTDPGHYQRPSEGEAPCPS